jgi:hypothetical protein
MPMTDLAVDRVDSVSTPPLARREIIRLYNRSFSLVPFWFPLRGILLLVLRLSFGKGF